MSEGQNITDEDVAELVRDVERAAVAYSHGDLEAYAELISHAEDYTLMQPYGGDIQRGFEFTPQAATAIRSFFAGGEAAVELQQAYWSGDLAVLAMVERQHGEVGGLPDQDWALRGTLVFRRAGSGWELAHRHADPLVHPVSFERVAQLARGEG